jgi:hypothetical protein
MNKMMWFMELRPAVFPGGGVFPDPAELLELPPPQDTRNKRQNTVKTETTL